MSLPEIPSIEELANWSTEKLQGEDRSRTHLRICVNARPLYNRLEKLEEENFCLSINHDDCKCLLHDSRKTLAKLQTQLDALRSLQKEEQEAE